MIHIATIAAAAAIAGATPALSQQINITTTYTRVHIQVWSETIDQQAVATTWCKGKGHGNAVHIVYAGLRKLGGQPGGKAYYQKIVCMTVPLQA